MKKSVTEVHVTQVSPDKMAAFQEWLAKIHQMESQFPGFEKVYEQAPADPKGSWITLLQFDTLENLERWSGSPERKTLMEEMKGFVESQQTHRVFSSFDGWFGSSGTPPLWKQTMLVLLVLFPIVMLEFKYLSPFTAGLNPSLATFIGNALSVSLISWPMMPIALSALGWWLKPQLTLKVQLYGVFLLSILYLIEIFLFW